MSDSITTLVSHSTFSPPHLCCLGMLCWHEYDFQTNLFLLYYCEQCLRFRHQLLMRVSFCGKRWRRSALFSAQICIVIQVQIAETQQLKQNRYADLNDYTYLSRNIEHAFLLIIIWNWYFGIKWQLLSFLFKIFEFFFQI